MKTLFDKVQSAAEILQGVALHTPLCHHERLSRTYDAQVWLKREDLQPVRSYKLRGAYYKIASLPPAERTKGIVCASAGNHAQGVAFACNRLGARARIVMPLGTPAQKIRQTRFWGGHAIEVLLWGDTFDDAYEKALSIAKAEEMHFIHPFDDEMVIAGQGTAGLEILGDRKAGIDYLFVPIGGGGLAAGLCTVFERLSPQTRIIGVEPAGAASMRYALAQGTNAALAEIDRFVDGAAVKKVGALPYTICRSLLAGVVTIPEDIVCRSLIGLHEEDAIMAEPAGALSVAALGLYADAIQGKNVVCLLSGGNNDNSRMEEIRARSLSAEKDRLQLSVSLAGFENELPELWNGILREAGHILYCKYNRKDASGDASVWVDIELHAQTSLTVLADKLLRYGASYRLFRHDNRMIG